MPDESPELIEQQMEQTRASLTDKVVALEQQVVGTLHTATTTVDSVRGLMQDTVSTVKTGMQESVHGLTEGLRDALDVRPAIQNHPWAAVGGATAAGFLVGLAVFGPSREGLPPPTPFYSGSGSGGGEPPRSRSPGVFDALFAMLGQEVRKLGEQAIAHASQSLRTAMDQEIPKLIDRAMPSNLMGQGGDDAGADAHRPNGHSRFSTSS